MVWKENEGVGNCAQRGDDFNGDFFCRRGGSATRQTNDSQSRLPCAPALETTEMCLLNSGMRLEKDVPLFKKHRELMKLYQALNRDIFAGRML